MKIRRCRARAVCGLLFSLGTGLCYAEKQFGLSISKVDLLVKANASDDEYPSSGALYKVSSAVRTHVADIDSSGLPDRPVRCNFSERFEAEARSQIDRPLDPIRLLCAKTMKFRFRRSIITTASVDQAFLEVVAGTPTVPINQYGYYSQKLKDAGALDAAVALYSQAVAATARDLGDEKLDKYVLRVGGRLKWNPAGTSALRDYLSAYKAELDDNVKEALEAQLRSIDQWTLYAKPSGIASPNLVACTHEKAFISCASANEDGDAAAVPATKSVIFRAFGGAP